MLYERASEWVSESKRVLGPCDVWAVDDDNNELYPVAKAN